LGYGFRLPLWLTVGIVLALIVRIAAVWGELPGTMASHFGVSGQPDGWMSKEGFFLVMAVVGGGTVALLFAMRPFLLRLPARWINLPNREYWLANDERRVEALRRLSWFMEWMAMATAALLAVATELAIRANLTQRSFANGPFLIFLALYFVFVIATLVLQFRAMAVPQS
jgi:uncharacterized membrane protein